MEETGGLVRELSQTVLLFFITALSLGGYLGIALVLVNAAR
jgi:hypothetical protein